jgi:nitrate/nitrite-specific signal transduction histidine kinase
MASRARLATEVRVSGERPLPAEVQVGLYRIAQEALNNVVKHAHAQRVEIVVDCGPAGVELSVTDDGIGFDPTRVPVGHFGMSIMRERAEEIGADLAITPGQGAGTRLIVRWVDRAAQSDGQSTSESPANNSSGASPLLTNASAPAASARSRSSGRVLKTTMRKRG